MKKLSKDTLEFRELITECEKQILAAPQLPHNITHYFSDGIYYREMVITEGTVLTGAVHKTEHRMIIIGDLEIWDGESTKRFTGYHTFLSKPGAKRLGYAHSDTIVISLHPTNETDPDQLRRDLVCESFPDYDGWVQAVIEEQKKIESHDI